MTAKLRKQAMNITNQLFDIAEVPVVKRQEINDKCDAFVAGLLDEIRLEVARQCAEIAWSEHLEDPPSTDGDVAYQAGVEDATNAIRREFGLDLDVATGTADDAIPGDQVDAMRRIIESSGLSTDEWIRRFNAVHSLALKPKEEPRG